jgi:endonuclease/exonuclease/phosphatase family metal-dependent hydrolase
MSRTECTVLTFNVFHDLPAHRYLDRRCAIVAEAIASRRPHLVALQEVMRSADFGDTGAKILEMLNRFCGADEYRLDYAAADGLREGQFFFEEGVAILSRIEPEGAAESCKFLSQINLTADFAGGRYRLLDDRIALRRRFRLESGSQIDFYATHLTDRPEAIDGVPVRRLQAGELIGWARTRERFGGTTVIAGDLNDLPDSEAVAALKDGGFVDLHEAFGSGPGYTNDRDDIDIVSGRATHNQRIDYLMVRPENERSPEVSEVGLFADKPHREPDGSWLWPSDHIGVIATLRL